MNREALREELGETFGGSEAARRAVARQAGDLADDGRLESDLGHPLTIAAIRSNLRDAPDEYTLIERWNWWMGALELSHGGYDRFRVRPDIERQ